MGKSYSKQEDNNPQQYTASSNKKAKIDINDTSFFLDTNNISMDACDTTDISMEGSQISNLEENILLVPKKDSSVMPTNAEKRLKIIESKIAFYNKRIAALDEQEVDDDSVNSAYIRCEKLKMAVVSLYNERCQLIGNQQVKRRGIRLKLAEGRPPGPTKALERFLNQHCNKDGEPPFPDFCDVVTCVTEANEKDSLGWTKAQIMHEASTLFTLCGRALQKRRQNKEYRDLLNRVKSEEVERDPADDDPQLRAKLEENRRIAVKKESDILERFTMLQYAAPKAKSQKITTTTDTKNGNNDLINKSDGHLTLAHKNNEVDNQKLTVNESEKSDKKTLKSSDTNMNIKTNLITVVGTSEDAFQSDATDCVCDSRLICGDIENLTSVPKQSNIVANSINNIQRKLSESAGHINETSKNVNISNNNLKENKCDVANKQLFYIEAIESQAPDENLMAMFNKMGDNFTLSVEIMSDS